jgi:serine/threonine protein kinase
MHNLIGTRLGQYELRQLLGDGGMGSVYRAVDVQLSRSVAIKVMHPHIARQEQFRERFLQEARAIARLDHPHIVDIHTFDTQDDLSYMVMEFVPSGSLRAYLKQQYSANKILEVGEALKLTRQVASALAYAHENGMIHRDVKPDNILLKYTTGSGSSDKSFMSLLTDFGLVKVTEGEFQTNSAHPMGTLPYMSPEQLKGGDIDGRTDLYALGIMMYELVVGELPFRPTSMHQAAEMHIGQEPPRPSIKRNGIMSSLEGIILKAIAKNPHERYQTGYEMIDAIEDVESGEADKLTRMDSMAIGGTSVDSLGTYLASMPGIPMGNDLPVIPTPADLPNDRLVIQRTGYSPQYVELIKASVTLGREKTADIRLASSKVSREHIRIERKADGSYTVTDLGSTNKTFVDGVQLLSNVPEAWLPDQVVSIGEFRLSLQYAAAVGLTQEMGGLRSVGDVHSVGQVPSVIPGSLPPDQPQSHVGTSALAIQVVPSQVVVNPGQRAEAQVMIVNQSSTVEHYRIQVQGVPFEWVTAPATPLQLLPGTQGSIPIGFHPPMQPSSTGGYHPFGVRVSSEERGMEIGRGEGTLEVRPYHRFSTDLNPARVNRGGRVRLSVNNQGNTSETYTITGRDRENGLIFDPPTIALAVGSGQTGVFDIAVRPRQSPLIGGGKMYPFELIVAGGGGMDQRQAGELMASGRIPTWMAGILTFLCVGLLGATALLGGSLLSGGDDETPETRAENLSGTEIRETVNAENTATAEIVNATVTEQVRLETATAIAQETGGVLDATLTSIAITQTALAFTNTPAATNTPIPTATTAPTLTPLPIVIPTSVPTPGIEVMQHVPTVLPPSGDVIPIGSRIIIDSSSPSGQITFFNQPPPADCTSDTPFGASTRNGQQGYIYEGPYYDACFGFTYYLVQMDDGTAGWAVVQHYRVLP